MLGNFEQVEELQLKSRELGQDLATTSTSMSQMKLDAAVTSDQINKQELDLNVQHSTLLKSLEESEDEDEWLCLSWGIVLLETIYFKLTLNISLRQEH